MAQTLSTQSFFECRAVEVLVGGSIATKEHCVPTELELAGFTQFANEAMKDAPSPEHSLQALCSTLQMLTSLIAVRTFRLQACEIIESQHGAGGSIRVVEESTRAVKLYFWGTQSDFIRVEVEEERSEKQWGKAFSPVAVLCHERATRVESLPSFSSENISASDMILEASRICSTSRLREISAMLQRSISSLTFGLLLAVTNSTAVMSFHSTAVDIEVCRGLALSVSVDTRTGRVHAFLKDHHRLPSALLRNLETCLDALFIERSTASATGGSGACRVTDNFATVTGANAGLLHQVSDDRDSLDLILIEIIRCGTIESVSSTIKSLGIALTPNAQTLKTPGAWGCEVWDLDGISGRETTLHIEARFSPDRVTAVDLNLIVCGHEISINQQPQTSDQVEIRTLHRIPLPSPEFLVPARKKSRKKSVVEPAGSHDAVEARVHSAIHAALMLAPLVVVALELLNKGYVLRIAGFSDNLSPDNFDAIFRYVVAEPCEAVSLDVVHEAAATLTLSVLAEGKCLRWTRQLLGDETASLAEPVQVIPLLRGGRVTCSAQAVKGKSTLFVDYEGMSAIQAVECAMATLLNPEPDDYEGRVGAESATSAAKAHRLVLDRLLL